MICSVTWKTTFLADVSNNVGKLVSANWLSSKPYIGLGICQGPQIKNLWHDVRAVVLVHFEYRYDTALPIFPVLIGIDDLCLNFPVFESTLIAPGHIFCVSNEAGRAGF